MKRRNGKQHAMLFIFTVLLMAANSAGKTAAQSCPDAVPIHAAPPRAMDYAPFWNLYWHDPQDPWLSAFGKFACQPAAETPVWYSSVELLPLMRDQEDDLDFQSLGPQNPILGTNDLKTEFDAGARIMVGCTLTDWYRLEGVYIGDYGWQASESIRNTDANSQGGTGNLFSPFSNFGASPGTPGQDFNNFASISLASRMKNGEINLRRRLALPPEHFARTELSVLLGARFISLEEQFGYRTESSIPAPMGAINDVRVAAKNNLTGIQAGFLTQFLVAPRAWIDFELKGAIFQNVARQTTLYTNVDNNGTTSTFAGFDQQDRTAFLGDFSLMYNWQFAPSWTFRAGYNAITIAGVALGSENFQRDAGLLRFGPAGIDHSGRIVYHGPSVGLVWAR